MGPGLGQQLGLDSLPRHPRSGTPVPRWSGGLGALGTSAAVGATATTSAAVGAWG